MTTSNSRYLAVSSGHIDGLINYVLDVKPYHVKLSEVVEQYIFNDNVSTKFSETDKLLAFLGPDILPSVLTTPGVRLKRSNSWMKEVSSDGHRTTFPVPLTSVYKFASHVSADRFSDNKDEHIQIPGLTEGVFSKKRWDGDGITNVRVGNYFKQDSYDYLLSHGVYTFETRSNQRWKELDLATVGQFPINSGELLYADEFAPSATISEITGGNYEEWTLTCITPGSFTIRGSSSGVIGTATYGQTFTHPRISFKFTKGVGTTGDTTAIGDVVTLTPHAKITVHPTAIEQSWSLIKTNPIVMASRPTLLGNALASMRDVGPDLSVHVRSLDYVQEQYDWSVVFSNTTEFTVRRVDGDDNEISFSGSLNNGLSFKNEFIHFTIIPNEGIVTGDRFTFSTKQNAAHYAVYGSVTGWAGNATIGKWYWNGSIGFKIPKLEYFAKKLTSTIVTSDNITSDNWVTVLTNNQVLKTIEFQDDTFFVAGENSIVGTSTDGDAWNENAAGSFTPQPNRALVVVGAGGRIVTSANGDQWDIAETNVSHDLHAVTTIPNFLSTPDFVPSPGVTGNVNCSIVVGDRGTILTSGNLVGWSQRVSGTTQNLNGVTWSNDAIIAVGNNGTILRSLDRLTWTTITSNTIHNLNGVIYEPVSNSFIAVGEYGTIVRSTDGGLTWSNLLQFTDGTFNDIAYGDGKFVAVGYSGWTAFSTNGIVWNRYFGKALASISYGAGKFVAVGAKVDNTIGFQTLKSVHSSAVPSAYTIKFVNDTSASVNNNVYGYRRGLKINEDWSDEFCSFRLNVVPGQFTAGDVVQVFIAPAQSFAAADGSGLITTPLLYNQELFPLVHSYGAVIFKTPLESPDVIFEDVVIDKAYRDTVRLKVSGSSSRYPELGAVNDWIPLEFRYFTTSGSSSNFSNLSTRIEAYLASDSSYKVFTITQPQYALTNRNASATLVFESAFLLSYLPFNTKFAMMFIPEDTWGQRLRVKVTENLISYSRVRFDFDDIVRLNIGTETIESFVIAEELNFVDTAFISFAEGGALPFDIGYDIFPYDHLPYDTSMIHNGVVTGARLTSPGVIDFTGNPEDWFIDKPTASPSIRTTDTTDVEVAAASFTEGFSIVERNVSSPSTIETLSIFYSGEPIVVTQAATQYLVTHSFSSTPNIILESLTNPGVFENPVPNLNVYEQVPSAVSTRSFIFSPSAGLGVPFRLTVA